MTDIAPYKPDAIMAMLTELQPEPDVKDVERVAQLMEISAVMAAQRCSHSEAVRRVGLNPSTVYRWRQDRPWVHTIASRLLFAGLDRRIDDTVMAYWGDAVEQLCKDTVDLSLDPVDRRAAIKLLHQLVVGPLSQETEAMERAIAKGRREEMTVRQRQEFPPVQAVVSTIILADGRSVLPGSKTAEIAVLEAGAVDGEWEESEPVDSAAGVLESQ